MAPSPARCLPGAPAASTEQLTLGFDDLAPILPSTNAATIPASSCIFCRHADPTVNTVVQQCRTMYVRLDNFPASHGHLEIVPFRHVESFFDLTQQEIKDFTALMTWVRPYLERNFSPDGYTVGINDGPAAGQTVNHLHIHVIPRHFGDVEDPRGGIRRIFAGCNPDNWR